MIFDGHVHLNSRKADKDKFQEKLKQADIAGGILLSRSPASFLPGKAEYSAEQRVQMVLQGTDFSKNWFAFYWIDPLEEDAKEQVQLAKKRGVDGLKVICNNFYPGAEKPMQVWRAAAQNNLPILFHSGISYGGINSSKYHRPAEFEALFNIEGIRFCLAHISWPWCDECLAVYGKYVNKIRSINPDLEMFIDLTPGTPPIYRENVFWKIFNIGYDIEDNLIFGTDNRAGSYDVRKTEKIISRDNQIYEKLKIKDSIKNKIYAENLRRFVQPDF